mmetsp:Transcript_83075/g.149890  ORF Transcript_83075/g.149890 Transcript_83075/m.149890 type:complete len:275 (+) Transcript_83075:623-1447(+)
MGHCLCARCWTHQKLRLPLLPLQSLPKCGDYMGSSICKMNYKFLPDNLCILGECTAQQCCVEKELCAECQGEDRCPDKDKTFYPSKRCSGQPSKSCNSIDCSGLIQKCSVLLNEAQSCAENSLIVPSISCSGEACPLDECCQEKERCSSIGLQSFCKGATVFRSDCTCEIQSSASCGADSCCGPPMTCKSEKFEQSLCVEPNVYMALNRCGGGSCSLDQCCSEKEKCISVGSSPALAMCQGKNGTEFAPDNRCKGADSSDCSADECCIVKTADA